ncbi:MAG TPA: hypothetical protein VGV18_03870 [Verrucomicrobiae bacterium]|nr:hypothetical protein [Verrucomicrobiae bacterium]
MKQLQYGNVIIGGPLYRSISPDAAERGAQEQLSLALKTSLAQTQRRHFFHGRWLPDWFPS